MSEKESMNGTRRRRRSRFFREPSRRWWWSIGFVLSIGAIYYGLAADTPVSQNPTLHTLRFLCLGVGGLLVSAAEFLPRGRIPLAGRLRIVGYTLFWVFVGLLLVEIGLESVLSRS